MHAHDTEHSDHQISILPTLVLTKVTHSITVPCFMLYSRKLLREKTFTNLRFDSHPWKSCPQNCRHTIPTWFSVQNTHILLIRGSFLPQTFPALWYAAAISWYEGIAIQEVIVQGVRQGTSARGPLERKQRWASENSTEILQHCIIPFYSVSICKHQIFESFYEFVISIPIDQLPPTLR